MTDTQTLMTPEERETAIRGWTRYCTRSPLLTAPRYARMCHRLRRVES